nr:methyl-accepting chemotaxis protein [Paenibacillus turpanensis]
MKQSFTLNSVQTKLILVIALALTVPSLLLGYITYKETEFVQHTAVIGKKEELEQLSKQFTDIFNKAEADLDQVSKNPELQHTSYAFPKSSGAGYSNMPSVNQTDKADFYVHYFEQLMDNNPNMLNVYLASSTGEFYVYPVVPKEVDLTQFDPRGREWYTEAAAAPGQVVWTEPYLDTGSKTSTITFAKTVHDPSGNVVGVVGMDFNLNEFAMTMQDNIRNKTILVIIVSFVVGMAVMYLFVRQLIRKIRELQEGIKALQHGDFTRRVEIRGSDEFSDLGNRYNEMVHSLGRLIQQVVYASREVTGASQTIAQHTTEYSVQSQEIAVSVEEIAQGAAAQAEKTETGYQEVNGLVDLLHSLKTETDETVKLAGLMASTSRDGYERLEQMERLVVEGGQKNQAIVETIEQLNEKSQKIVGVTGLIRDIASQTNLLALNAAIEAARAGEHGAGFAVVAGEVRKLAEESAKSANEIQSIVDEINVGIQETIRSIHEARENLEEQNATFRTTKASFSDISSAVESASESIHAMHGGIERIDQVKDRILSSITDMAAVSQQTAAGSQQVSATVTSQGDSIQRLTSMAEQLDETAKRLIRDTDQFILSRDEEGK